MWLISTSTFRLEFVQDSSSCPPYGILSHTWDDGEVTFQDLTSLAQISTEKEPGLQKIAKFCQVARENGFQWAWADTCCIDKTSSAELTEAINSMFRWYENSAMCFVWLSDLPAPRFGGAGRGSTYDSDGLDQCRWFTRGWTLQELVAPKRAQFYDCDWNLRYNISDVSFRHRLSKITNVDVHVFGNREVLSSICVARRTSWASKRQTTRTEDIAYCLFGIFDVNLPLIYGEGTKAFVRLQEAIVSDSNDLSLFAWRSKLNAQPLRGLFALSPSEFWDCSGLQRNAASATPRVEFSLTNAGVRIVTCLIRDEDTYILPLYCFDTVQLSSESTNLFIRLLKTAQNEYVRCSHAEPVRQVDPNRLSPKRLTDLAPIYIPKVVSHRESHLLTSALTHRLQFKVDDTNSPANFKISVAGAPEHIWDCDSNTFFTNGESLFLGILYITFTASTSGPTQSPTESRRNLLSYSLDDRNLSSWQHESDVLAIVRLRSVIQHTSSFDSTDEMDLENSTSHRSQPIYRPWAALYRLDNREEVSQLIHNALRAPDGTFSAEITSLLGRTVSDEESFRKSMSFVPEWYNRNSSSTSLGASTGSVVEKFVSENSIQISISSHIRSHARWGMMYEVVLRIENLA